MDIDRLSKKIESFEESAQTDSQQEPVSSPVRHPGIESVPDALENGAVPSAFAELIRQAGNQPEVTADPHTGAEILNADPHLREKVNLAETFPGGKAIDAGLGAFSLPGTQLRTEPSHYGIDLSKGGIHARDLIAQVLGITNQSTAAPTGVIPALPGMSSKANWLGDFVDKLVAFLSGKALEAPVDVGLQLLHAPELIEEVTGDATDGLRGVKAFGTGDSGTALLNKVDEGSKYVNPEGGPTPDIFLTAEQAMKIIELLKNINVRPENADGSTPEVTAADLKGASPIDPFTKNPNLRFVADRNPDYMETALTPEEIAGRLEVIQSAKGPDVDPELAPSVPEAPPEGTGPGGRGGIQ